MLTGDPEGGLLHRAKVTWGRGCCREVERAGVPRGGRHAGFYLSAEPPPRATRSPLGSPPVSAG